MEKQILAQVVDFRDLTPENKKEDLEPNKILNVKDKIKSLKI
jgi:hypothetical protein